ncbi:MAG: type I pullulanase [Bacteroidetes bacterium]|nr:type I pullulanase [Bacteroidota bacterium]
MKLISLFFIPTFCFAQINVSEFPVYSGKDLGVVYAPEKTTCKVWAPKASAVKMRLYPAGYDGEVLAEYSLNKGMQGTWEIEIKGDIKNNYYTFQVMQDGKWLEESPDIYAKAVGVNGKRGMVVNLIETNPEGWIKDVKPELKNATDIVIYESHVRDFSMHANSGMKQKGKYLAFTETGSRNEQGQLTGIDHLKELGITHIHLLPTYDFNSVDESKLELNTFNWGYDPVNYNVPEGSYSSNPADGNVRILEFKKMVQALHANGIRVILDMVYNHTANRESPFNQFAPNYFYRQKADGNYSDASGCGNETASERPMMRKFMIASAAYWATEYHVDGFRFDLMGVHDIETMNAISDSLHKINPSIFIYGEGWTAGASPLAEEQRAVKKNTFKLSKIAAFSDDLRDALHGPYNKVTEKGFVSGATTYAESVKFGIAASTQHPQVNYSAVNYSKAPWAAEPYQCINYVSCHDDNTLFDRLKIGNPAASEEALIKMDKLSQAIVLTSQGVPFIHSGAEFLRSKQGIANSYNLPDSINALDWTLKSRHEDVFNYYRGMIALRKAHPAFRMTSTKMIQKNLKLIESNDPSLVMYQIMNHANGDSWKNILVILNGNSNDKEVQLPEGTWILASDGNSVKEKGLSRASSKQTISGTSAFIYYRLD